MVPPELIGPSILALTQGISAFTTFLPPIAELRKADPMYDTSTAADVRLGEVAAVTLTVGVGVIASSLTGSPVPAFTAVVVAAALVCLYETTLRADRPFEARGTVVATSPKEVAA